MTDPEKTLVILSPAFPENESATHWVPSQQLLVKALKKNFPGVRIIVLALLYPYKDTTYEWHQVRIISFDGTHKRKLRRLVLWKKVWQTLNRIHNRYTIAGIFSFWCGECSFIGHYFGKRHSVRHFSWICGQDARQFNKWVSVIHPREQELVAMSFSLANEFERNHGVRPLRIIPNAIDPDVFPNFNHKGRTIDVLGVGSLEPLKQYDLFTRIIASLQQTFPHIRVVHCGSGREEEKIKALIKTSGLDNNLQLLGVKTHEEILALMQQSTLFLHTSDYEGFSTVCLEALYAGARVLSFCYPLDHPVRNWQVAKDAEEMTAMANAILQQPPQPHDPVLLYTMDESARAVMNLFHPES